MSATFFFRLFGSAETAPSTLRVADHLGAIAPVRLACIGGFSPTQDIGDRLGRYMTTPMIGTMVNVVCCRPHTWVTTRVAIVPGTRGHRAERAVVTSELRTARVLNILVVSGDEPMPEDERLLASAKLYDALLCDHQRLNLEHSDDANCHRWQQAAHEWGVRWCLLSDLAANWGPWFSSRIHSVG